MYITLKIEAILGNQLLTLKLNFFKNNSSLPYTELYTLFSSSFGDAIIILSIVVGLVCLELLGPKNLFQSTNNISIFYFFIFFTIIMCSTTNLLIMFISFEFMFLPTVYFAYTLGYTKKIDTASRMLIYWTLFGSFLVLSNLGYLYYQYKTASYLYLMQKKFSDQETFFLFINFLLGFGIKIPLAPLHF
jgi:NADH:ubiquinone oxidoreductase subunit 4 (subunit M)